VEEDLLSFETFCDLGGGEAIAFFPALLLMLSISECYT
jgi:hypothetical protein